MIRYIKYIIGNVVQNILQSKAKFNLAFYQMYLSLKIALLEVDKILKPKIICGVLEKFLKSYIYYESTFLENIGLFKLMDI